ncbi:MAG: hypothetical protein MK132_20555 [Lentisphaerales bacterium]|nr:hypothetical protein [Lentisphaerales bacterium]
MSNEESFDKIYPETLKNDYQRSYLFKYFDRQRATFLIWGYAQKENTYLVDLMTYPKVIPNANRDDAHFIANFRPILFRQKLFKNHDGKWQWTAGSYVEDVRTELNKISAKRMKYNEAVEIQKLSGVEYPLDFKRPGNSKPLVYHAKVRKERLAMLKKGILKAEGEHDLLLETIQYELYKKYDIYYPSLEELNIVLEFEINQDYILDLKAENEFKTPYEKYLKKAYKGGTLKIILEKQLTYNDKHYHVSIVRQNGLSPVFSKEENRFIKEEFYSLKPIYLKKVGNEYEHCQSLLSTYFRELEKARLYFKQSADEYKENVRKLGLKDSFLKKLIPSFLEGVE